MAESDVELAKELPRVEFCHHGRKIACPECVDEGPAEEYMLRAEVNRLTRELREAQEELRLRCLICNRLDCEGTHESTTASMICALRAEVADLRTKLAAAELKLKTLQDKLPRPSVFEMRKRMEKAEARLAELQRESKR